MSAAADEGGEDRSITIPEGERVDSEPNSLEESELFAEYVRRLGDERDLRVIVTATDSGTGLGKTILAMALCKLFDAHEWSAEKATLDPREYVELAGELPRGSAILWDEAELGGDKRRAMSDKNLEISQAFDAGRYRQIWGVMTLPSKRTLDERLVQKSDYWILVQCRGEADMYKLGENDMTGELYKKGIERLTWDNFDHWDDYQELTEMKKTQVEGEVARKFVHVDEYEAAKKNFWEKSKKKTRYFILWGAANYIDKYGSIETQSDLTEAIEMAEEELGSDEEYALGQSMISQLKSSESFESFYRD
jgi:hypothetical protein